MLRLTRLDLALLLVVLLLGAINLPQPFSSDQALFALGGKRLAAGAVLYRDFWDVKQPGIYQFYRAGGTLFGFSELGIHLFELLYLMVFAVTMILALRDWFEHRWAAGLAALATVGWFYAFTSDWHLTQVEGLVGFPMFLAAWLAARGGAMPPERRAFLLLAGIASGVVLLFKLLFLPIVALFWIVALIARARLHRRVNDVPHRCRRDRARRRARARSGDPRDGRPRDTRARGVDLLRLSGRGDARARRVPGALAGGRPAMVLPGWAPLLALGVAGALWPARGYRRLLSLNLVIWFVAGFAVILMQKLSYFQYHFLLLAVPAGLLGTRGIHASPPRRRAPASSPDAGRRGSRWSARCCCSPRGRWEPPSGRARCWRTMDSRSPRRGASATSRR